MKEKLRILVVDDSAVVRKAFLRILGDEYDLVEAENGEIAWDILNQDDDICAVFADLGMAHLNGQGLLRRLRTSENDEIKSLPFILVASESDDYESKRKALEAGVTDFITKPFDSVFLMACAKSHVHPNEKKLSYARSSTLDPLTRLASKHYFIKRGVQDISAAFRHQISLALILISIDGFTDVQDVHGERAAKGLLRKISSYIAAEVRLEDTVARIDTNKFAVLISRVDFKGVEIIANRIKGKLNKKTIRFGNIAFEVTLSIGAVILLHSSYMDFDEFYASTEECLGQAIADGGNHLIIKTIGVPYENEIGTFSSKSSVGAASIEIDLNKVVNLIGQGELEKVNQFSSSILSKVKPIIEHFDKELRLGLSEQLESIEDHINNN